MDGQEIKYSFKEKDHKTCIRGFMMAVNQVIVGLACREVLLQKQNTSGDTGLVEQTQNASYWRNGLPVCWAGQEDCWMLFYAVILENKNENLYL